jgi:superfamily I DNA and RNA helicase
MLSKVSDMFRIDIEDKYTAIIYCWEAVNKTTDKLVFDTYVNSLFSKRGKSILMSSIHKIKGMEHKTVFVLNAHGMPIKWKGQKNWELQQELNLKLVALTRSTDQMYLVVM